MNNSSSNFTQAQNGSLNDSSNISRNRHDGGDVEKDSKSRPSKIYDGVSQLKSPGDEETNTQRIMDALPVSIMLRNCFPPNAYNDDTYGHYSKKQSGSMTIESNQNTLPMCGSGDIGIENDNDNVVQHYANSVSKQHESTTSIGDEDENDTTLDNYQIFTKTNQWRDQAKKIIFLPIEMEIVVTYEFLVQFHSHQKNEHTRSRIRELFGLDIANEKKLTETSKLNGVDNLYMGDEGNQISTTNERVVVLCSKLQDTRSSHPLWDHVNEKLDDLYNLIPQEDDLWSDLYKAMRIQFRAIVPSNSNFDTKAGSLQSDFSNDVINCKESKSILLATCPLHPYKLEPITPSLQDGAPNNKQTSILIGASKFRDNVPYSLPPNSILIHYSDGTTRVSPELFHLLGKKKLIETARSSSQQRLENIDVDKFARRFDDEVFNVLEDKGYVKAKFQFGEPQSEKGNVPLGEEVSSLADVTKAKPKSQEYESTAIIEQQHSNGTSNTFSRGSSQVASLHSSRSSSSRGAFTDAFDSMRGDGRKTLKLGLVETKDNPPVNEDNEDSPKMDKRNGTHSEVTNECDQDDAHEQEDFVSSSNHDKAILKEIDELELEISQLEKNFLEEDVTLQQYIEAERMHFVKLKNLLRLQDIEKTTQKLDIESSIIEREVATLIIESQHVKCFIKWRRKQLLKSLSQIYPIQILPDSVYTIRGIHLPSDMHSLTAAASDEIISAGLGFVCHVVSLCSKYLSIPLRYRVICNSSRSAVRDDVDVFPLFKERVVEKEQFDRAIVLLHRNIDLLIHMSKVPMLPTKSQSKPAHILSKLKYLIQCFTEN